MKVGDMTQKRRMTTTTTTLVGRGKSLRTSEKCAVSYYSQGKRGGKHPKTDGNYFFGWGTSGRLGMHTYKKQRVRLFKVFSCFKNVTRSSQPKQHYVFS